MQAHARVSNHPSVLSLIGAYEDEHFVYIILEKCTGGFVFSTTLDREPISEPNVVHIVKQLLAAVDHCHLQGMLWTV